MADPPRLSIQSRSNWDCCNTDPPMRKRFNWDCCNTDPPIRKQLGKHMSVTQTSTGVCENIRVALIDFTLIVVTGLVVKVRTVKTQM